MDMARSFPSEGSPASSVNCGAGFLSSIRKSRSWTISHSSKLSGLVACFREREGTEDFEGEGAVGHENHVGHSEFW